MENSGDCDKQKALEITPCNTANGDADCAALYKDTEGNEVGCCAYMYLNGYGSGWEYVIDGHYCANRTHLFVSYGLMTPCWASGFGYCDGSLTLLAHLGLAVTLAFILNMLA